VVAARDLAVFSLGRLPDNAESRRVAEELADRLHAFVGERRMLHEEAGQGLGVHPNRLRYAAVMGTVLIRWDGARQPTIWTVPPPRMEAREARLELARRYLHIFGPTKPDSFAQWAGISLRGGIAAFEALGKSLTPVRTPIGDAWILTKDEQTFRAETGPAAPARLLPSGDTYFLLQADDRELLVPQADHRSALWTSRVWPGAVLVDGNIVGTWRRANEKMTIEPWRRLTRKERDTVEAEAAALPLPGVEKKIIVRWDAS
jgi:hypothetical protein